MIWRWLGLAIVLALPITLYLSQEFSSSGGRGQRLSFEEPFRATETRTVTLAKSEHFLTEIEFEPPNAWQRICPDQPYCSTIVVGDQAWNLQGDDWVEVSTPLVFGTDAFELLAWAGPELQGIGAGPAASTEATTRRQAHFPYYGESLSLSGVTNKRGEPVSTYRGATLTITTTEGYDSGRLYELGVLVTGPHIHDETIVTFEYDVEVQIYPPLTAAQAEADPQVD